MVSSLPREAPSIKALYNAVLFATVQSLGLHAAMINHVQQGLRIIHNIFITEPKLNPRVGMTYIYLIKWFVNHCQGLMLTSSNSDD